MRDKNIRGVSTGMVSLYFESLLKKIENFTHIEDKIN